MRSAHIERSLSDNYSCNSYSGISNSTLCMAKHSFKRVNKSRRTTQ